MEPNDPEDQGTLSYYELFGPGKFGHALDLLTGICFGTLAVVFHTNALFLYGFAAVGSYFGLKGLSGVLAARGVTIDRRRGRARFWRGWLFPLWFRARRLDRYTTVLIGKELRRDGRRYTTVFPIQLAGHGRADELAVKKDYLQARQVGEEVAAYLGFDLVDATPGKPVRIAATDVGKSLRERLRGAIAAEKTSDPGHLVLPPLPAKTRTRCTVDGSWLFLEIPRPRLLGLLWYPLLLTPILAAVGAVIGFGIVAYMGMNPGDWNEHMLPAVYITLGLAGLGVIYGIFFMVLPRAFVRYQIEAHPGGLTVRRPGLLFRRTRTLTSGDLRELRLNRGGLQAIGSGQIVAFADNGVSAAELAWLHDAITRALAAQ
jgi:hypothetical protein